MDDPASTIRVRTATGGEIVLRARGIATAAVAGRWELRPAHRAIGWQETVPALTAAYVIERELPVEIHTDIEVVRPAGVRPETPDRPEIPGRAGVPGQPGAKGAERT